MTHLVRPGADMGMSEVLLEANTAPGGYLVSFRVSSYGLYNHTYSRIGSGLCVHIYTLAKSWRGASIVESVLDL